MKRAALDWLVATAPNGRLCGSSAAHPERVVQTFTDAHTRAGHTVQRLTFEEARARLTAPPAPAVAAPLPAVPLDLPAIGVPVRVPLGNGTVRAHLRWPDGHATHAGKVAALVRGPGWECLAFPDDLQLQPAPEPPAVVAAPPPEQLQLPRPPIQPQDLQPALF